MASSNNFKTPPNLTNYNTYDKWEKAFKIWQLVTDLPKRKQGAALILALSEKDRDIALEISIDDIHSDEGVDKILDKLGKIYKKDSVDAAYEDFENFIHYRRPADMSISKFITEFERRYAKAEEHKCSLSSNILAYFLLNQALK